MTTDEIITQFFFLVDDDNTDADQCLVLLNNALNAIYTRRMWNFLRKEDSSQTFTGTTRTYSTPSDFMYPVKAFRFNSATQSFTEMTIIRFEDRMKYHNMAGYLYYDPRQNQIVLTATPTAQNISGQTLYLVYQYQPTDLVAGGTPAFNRAFHQIAAFEMARMFVYNDQQEKERSFNREFDGEYNKLWDDMVNFDNRFEFGVSDSFQPVESWVNVDG